MSCPPVRSVEVVDPVVALPSAYPLTPAACSASTASAMVTGLALNRARGS